MALSDGLRVPPELVLGPTRLHPVVRLLMIALALAFVAQALAAQLLPPGASGLSAPTHWLAARPVALAAAWSAGQPPALLDWVLLPARAATSVVLHGSLGQLLGTLLTLWIFGSTLAGAIGGPRFLRLWGLGAAGSVLAWTAVCLAAGAVGWLPASLFPTAPYVGPSGADFAMLAAFGVLFGDRNIHLLLLPFSIQARQIAGVALLLDVGLGWGGSFHLVHLAGLLIGLRLARPARAPAPRLRVVRDEPLVH